MAVFAKKALLPGGWASNVRLQVANGQFSRITEGVRSESGDTLVGIVIPGLCNAHSHAFQRALAGHTEQRSPAGRDSFWTWREKMYELAARVDAAALTAIARQAYSEMLISGFTSVVEFHYLHRDPLHDDPDSAGTSDAMFSAISAAAADTGIRLTYLPVHYERAGFSDPLPLPRQRNFALSMDEFLEHRERAIELAGPLTNVGIGVHSLRAVREDSLQTIARLANDHLVPMHLHIAEQQQEVEQCVAEYGDRPVSWLLQNFEVGKNWCLVHATHIDTDEVHALAASGAVVGLCPSTEANLGDGLFPLHDFLAEDGRIAIGSDSHITINPFEELRWLEYGQRLQTRSRNIASLRDSHVGSELFDRALKGGVAASGQDAASISAGSAADFVALNDDDPMMVGHSDESRLDALVFSGYPLPVERVMVDGEWCVVDAEHVNRKSTLTEFTRAITHLSRDAGGQQ